MTFLRRLFGYPLFARELIERAARRRTYITRVLFGLALYAVFGLLVHQAIAQSGGTTIAIGFGHQLLGQLVKVLTWSLLLIQPAIMAGAISREKERDALNVLFLTRLTPGKILLEKYFAGLFPAASLLLLSLPLAAITMGYGGVSVPLLIAGGMVLGAAWLMSGAWALFCSAWCRTSLGALLMAYLGGAFLFMLPPLVYSVVHRDVLFGSVLTAVDVPEALWALWPQKVFESLLRYQDTTFSAAAKTEIALSAAERCVPMFAIAGVFLLLARIALVARATVRPARLTQWGLAWWTAWRDRRRSEQPRHRGLPSDAPVAWREHSRSIVGSGGQFFYFSTLACGVVMALSIFLLGLYPPTDGPERLQKVGVFLACFGTFAIVSTSVSSLLSEKVNGTLDILFTTPVGIDQLLREKAEAVRRYWILFGIMLAIVFGAQAWSDYEYTRSGANWRTLSQQWATGLLALAVYPPLLIWSSFLCAAWWGKRARAILAMLALAIIVCFGPLFVLEAWDPKWRENQSCLWWSLVSPLGILDANTHDRLPWFSQSASMAGRLIQVKGAPWVPVAVNFSLYTLLAFFVRWYCLRSADRMLRR